MEDRAARIWGLVAAFALSAALVVSCSGADDATDGGAAAGSGGGSGSGGGQGFGGGSGAGGSPEKDASNDVTPDALPDAEPTETGTDAPPDAPNLPVCPCYGTDGLYCGKGASDYASMNGCQVPDIKAHLGDVYLCKAGSWSVQTTCPNGCFVAPLGTNDGCNGTYHLPWTCGVTYTCTQGNNQGDHIAAQNQANAFDFGIPLNTPIRATRAGTVSVAINAVGPGQACYGGCVPFTQACCNSCLNTANRVYVDHGDGTHAIYWHLNKATVSVGQFVNQGDQVGLSGTTGCSTGPHLHFQVSNSSCGNTGYCATVPISFAEAGVPNTGDKVTSQNACGP